MKNISLRKWLMAAVMMIVPIVVSFVKPSAMGLDGITANQQQMLAIFIFAALSWIFELFPAWVTSVTVIALIALTDSDSAFTFYLNRTTPGQELGEVLQSSKILRCFGDPSIVLYIGGLVMALTASKIGLDAKLARAILHPFGKKPTNVLLGVMLATGILSMFMSDTATTALMVGMMTPVFVSMGDDLKGKAALALSITFSALIGGMGTPVGTPPAMLAFNAINDPDGLNLHLSFAHWMVVMIPLCLALIVLSWRVLVWMFPFSVSEVEIVFVNKATCRRDLIIVVVTYAITIFLWVTQGFTGVKNSVAALVPVVILSISGIFTSSDLNKLPWSVLWMFAGGLALGSGMDDVGLSSFLIEKVPFGAMSPLLILVVSALLCWALSNFISNTGTAALLIPVLTAMAVSMGDRLDGVGGGLTLIMGIAISASMAMSLPVSTPGNAIAFATGHVTQRQMACAGLVVGLLGLIIGYAFITLVGGWM
ncbi:MAG: SLC13/DASS family transporter [Bacteroidaceae bacterium]|nr:SLC13/DASS family transporter [Bacteroidaceae bacterium]